MRHRLGERFVVVINKGTGNFSVTASVMLTGRLRDLLREVIGAGPNRRQAEADVSGS